MPFSLLPHFSQGQGFRDKLGPAGQGMNGNGVFHLVRTFDVDRGLIGKALGQIVNKGFAPLDGSFQARELDFLKTQSTWQSSFGDGALDRKSFWIGLLRLIGFFIAP